MKIGWREQFNILFNLFSLTVCIGNLCHLQCHRHCLHLNMCCYVLSVKIYATIAEVKNQPFYKFPIVLLTEFICTLFDNIFEIPQALSLTTRNEIKEKNRANEKKSLNFHKVIATSCEYGIFMDMLSLCCSRLFLLPPYNTTIALLYLYISLFYMPSLVFTFSILQTATAKNHML